MGFTITWKVRPCLLNNIGASYSSIICVQCLAFERACLTVKTAS